jgi:hypothetical protein
MTKEKELRTLFPFLCLGFKTKPESERGSNFDERAEPCVLLRYEHARRAYLMLTLPGMALTTSIEVKIIKNVFPLRGKDPLSVRMDAFVAPNAQEEALAQIQGPGSILRRGRATVPNLDQEALVADTPALLHTRGPARTSGRARAPTQELGDQYINKLEHVQVFTAEQLTTRAPRDTREALTGRDKDVWLLPTLKHHAMLRDLKCFERVSESAPVGPKPVGIEVKYKFKYKGEQAVTLEEGEPKVRAVVRGDHCKEGVHYDEKEAPVAQAAATKMLIAYAVQRNKLLFQFDQETAFNGNDMDRTNFIVRLPPGFHPTKNEVRPMHLPPLYAVLSKALPGIPQGSLLHYRSLKASFSTIGFESARVDCCLFLDKNSTNAATVHVDDGVLAVDSVEQADQVLGTSGLGKGPRKIKYGPLTHFLGMDIAIKYTEARRTAFMSQPAYASAILERAGMLHCNPSRTPATPGLRLTKGDGDWGPDDEGMTAELYRTLAASTNFLQATRDDIRFTQGKIAKYTSNAGPEHKRALKKLLRFVKGTTNYGILFEWNATDPPRKDGALTITGYSDSTTQTTRTPPRPRAGTSSRSTAPPSSLEAGSAHASTLASTTANSKRSRWQWAGSHKKKKPNFKGAPLHTR